METFLNITQHNKTSLFRVLSFGPERYFKKKTKMNEESSGNPYQMTFKDVVIVLSDGNEILMNKCLNCNFVTRNNSFSKVAHW